MDSTWTFEELPDVAEIQERLKIIFPRSVDINGYIIREMGAKTIFTLLYCFCISGEEWIRPATITCMSDQQAAIQSSEERKKWLQIIQSKDAPRDIPDRWYKPNTREPIRDETLREMVRLNAVIEREGLATTSPLPRYSLQLQFATLFNPRLQGDNLKSAILEWQNEYLSTGALARVALARRMVTASSHGVLVTLPNGETRKLAAGPSNKLAKAVVEQFAKNFMKDPAVILMSESAKKLVLKDDDLCQAIGFDVDVSTVLPDLILAELGEEKAIIVFVECVATDGPINDRRKRELIELAGKAGYQQKDCIYVTVFKDRSDSASRRLVPSIAWGTFIWYASEPENIILLREGEEKKKSSIGEIMRW
ncbi:BsuBI/PstI family type II restriction endonuclease [Faecalicatena contorta]|uniref:BsuBI/PstI restriction endonuclease C-terminus n=1 Tax=Faecalicatena contorta TaxID=39482 RepID=A0A315ZWB2_9FIRM|nr:BsuBI/PstI family type II restriction endonuclease [Faecalicatena contorta]PWJ48894.1 BsuBI/PstI restriction endonuclease [Faecalicatena contorta]SUQ14984.1 BsuBI/PstI restriction endonuclease C-terminus [Faecalicatena contorta]